MTRNSACDDLETKITDLTKENLRLGRELARSEKESKKGLKRALQRLERSRRSQEAANAEMERAILQANQMAADAEIRNYQLETEMERRKKMEGALRESEERYRSIIENIEDGYYEIGPKADFTFVNEAMCKIMGYPRELLLTMNSADVVEEKHAAEVYASFIKVYESEKPLTHYNFSIVRKDGTRRELEISLSLMRDLEGKKTGFRGIARDVEKRKRYEEKLIYLAYHDALTGLANRKAFYERLDETLLRARRYNRPLTLLYLDIDRFKQVNDTYGHETGDEVLVEIARRLRDGLRKTDFICRMGGDEFTIILDGSPTIDPEAVARKISRDIAASYPIGKQNVDFIGASIGISRYPEDADIAGTLIRMADTAMYRSKEGKTPYAFYEGTATP